jgi:hypothetical protein
MEKSGSGYLYTKFGIIDLIYFKLFDYPSFLYKIGVEIT